MAMGIRMPAAWMVSPSCGTPASIGSSEVAAWDIGVGSSAVGEGHPAPGRILRLLPPFFLR